MEQVLSALLLPGCEYMKTGDSGVVSKGEVAASEADLLQGEPEGQQVGTHRQEKLQHEAAKKVVLGLVKEGTDALSVQLLDLSPASHHSNEMRQCQTHCCPLFQHYP